VYAFLTAAMPRAGGDYVFIGRILHPALGFAANWTMLVWNVVAFGVWGAYAVTLGIAPGLASIGLVSGNDGLISAAETMSSEPIAAFATGTVLILILAFLLTRGLRVTKAWWNTAVVIGFIGLIVGLIPLLTTDRAGFQSAFDGVAGAGAYDSVLAYGEGAGVLPLPAVALGATLLAVAMAGSGISGATWSTYTAGELKQGRSVTRELLVMMVPLGLMVVFWTIIPALVDAVAGHDFVVSINALYADPEAPKPLPGIGFPMPFHVVFASIASGSPIIAFIVALGNVAWFAALMPAFVMMFIRCVFAWSFDGLMPRFLSDVDPKTNVPVKATIVVLVLAELGILLWSFYPGIFAAQIAYYVAVFFFTFSIAGVAALLFPYIRPEMYQASPIAKYKVGSIPLISIAGAITIVFSLFTGWVNLTAPSLGVSTDIQRLMPLIIMILGFVVYYVAVFIRRSQGSNVELVFKEIPPD
jgi:amino acid transporter